MHPNYNKANSLTHEVIGAALEVHRDKGSGLVESIYEKCLMRELFLRNIQAKNQVRVPIEYKGYVFEEPLRLDIIIENKLILELKSVESITNAHKAQLLSYMKLLNIPIGLIINFNEPLLKNGIFRMVLRNADRP